MIRLVPDAPRYTDQGDLAAPLLRVYWAKTGSLRTGRGTALSRASAQVTQVFGTAAPWTGVNDGRGS